MTTNKLYQANPNFILRTIAGSSVLVAVGTGVADFRGYIQMNSSAEKIWKVLQNKVSQDDIIEALLQSFEVSREELTSDVKSTLATLVAKGMVNEYDS